MLMNADRRSMTVTHHQTPVYLRLMNKNSQTIVNRKMNQPFYLRSNSKAMAHSKMVQLIFILLDKEISKNEFICTNSQ